MSMMKKKLLKIELSKSNKIKHAKPDNNKKRTVKERKLCVITLMLNKNSN